MRQMVLTFAHQSFVNSDNASSGFQTLRKYDAAIMFAATTMTLFFVGKQ